VVCLVFNINLWLFELNFRLFNINFRLLSSSFNRKLDSVHNHTLVSSWSLQDNFCAGQLGIEHRLFPDCQPTCIFWIGQIRILHLVVLPWYYHYLVLVKIFLNVFTDNFYNLSFGFTTSLYHILRVY